MGVWFSANFYGYFFAGKTSKLTVVSEGELGMFSKAIFGSITEFVTGISNTSIVQQSDNFQQLYSYVSVYSSFGVIAVVVGLLVMFYHRQLKRR